MHCICFAQINICGSGSRCYARIRIPESFYGKRWILIRYCIEHIQAQNLSIIGAIRPIRDKIKLTVADTGIVKMKFAESLFPSPNLKSVNSPFKQSISVGMPKVTPPPPIWAPLMHPVSQPVYYHI